MTNQPARTMHPATMSRTRPALSATMLVWGFAAAGRPVAAVLAALLPLGVHAALRARVANMQRMFGEQLSDNLQVVASAMRAGHSFEGGLGVAATDAAEPMRSELNRIVRDERLGVSLEVAMEDVATRMDCHEFAQVGAIVISQRESGGNIAELLDNAVESLRFQADLRRMVRSLTSQGRFAGTVVTALPFAMALFLSVLSPGFFDAMLETSAGRSMFVVAGFMVLSGWLIIRKLVDIKV